MGEIFLVNNMLNHAYVNRAELAQYQLAKLNQLLDFVSTSNLFYQEKYNGFAFPLASMDDFYKLPFTTKKELIADQVDHAPYGRNHAFPESDYVRLNKTSGTSGRPLKLLDTQESWEWFADCWQTIYGAAGISRADRLFIAFSFGMFTGFWAAYEGGKKLGALVLTGGGQTSLERLSAMDEHEATVLLCTPSYAIHLAEVAKQNNMDIANGSIRAIITSGEPGGSIPSVRRHIEQLWGAKVYDHVGISEVGSYGYTCVEQSGVHLNEGQFIMEVIDPQTLQHVEDGEKGELLLTSLGRYGYPLIRYRTGDLVKKDNALCPCGDPHQMLAGGILGRADDMVIVRGVNIYPQSIEAIIREFAEVKEFRIIYYTENEMNQIRIQAECEADLVQDLANRLRERIGLRIEVEPVVVGSLPRFEMKARRIVDQRKSV
jgi:phenylacetate-CoA ligase